MVLPKSQAILLARMVLATAVKEQDDDPLQLSEICQNSPAKGVPEASDLDHKHMTYMNIFARDAGFDEISPCFPLSAGKFPRVSTGASG
jgi:hypothetical protein